ncbi:MAG TPA: response regulator transcription factor [Spongiibacteraceae bacterium]|nr:response regulator transcription factor [Spongiibacteraceae bacterium]HUH36892.1 response regulator transcription factor [Spongiibacteraceae bacterium]
MPKGLILSIEDDEGLQVVLQHSLEEEGYRVLCAGTVEAALENVNRANLSAILLDLTLPDGEGLDLIPMIRARTRAAIIVVSGKDSATEKVVCLEMGADDYMTKPFEMRELLARIKAVLRRAGPSAMPEMDPANDLRSAVRLAFAGGWSLDRSQFQLFDRDGRSAGLTTGEFRLLDSLVTAPNRALSREYLHEVTRDGQYDIYDRAIDIQIARLRRKLGDDTKTPSLIKTVRGVGYMFCAEVSIVDTVE